MQFYDSTTTANGIVNHAWGLVNTDINKYPIAACARDANRHYYQAVGWILESQDEWDWDDTNFTKFPISTTSLIASQQDYPLPAQGTSTAAGEGNILSIQRVEVTYDGTNWYRVNPIDVNEIKNATDTTTIAGQFSSANPKYDTRANSMFLYPIPDTAVTGGLKVWYIREPIEFTSSSTTAEPGFAETYHEIIPVGMAMDYVMRFRSAETNLYTMLKTRYNELKAGLQNYYGRRNRERQYVLKSFYNDTDFS